MWKFCEEVPSYRFSNTGKLDWLKTVLKALKIKNFIEKTRIILGILILVFQASILAYLNRFLATDDRQKI